MVIRVGYIREHFSSPLLQLADDDKGKTFTLVECPSGTGQVISRLENDEIDVAIALTDPLLAGIAKGSKAYKLVGSYVISSLNWAVVTGKDSKYNSIADLRGTKMGISRIGSGSHTMARVMALEQKWIDPATNLVEPMDFQVNNDIAGLNKSVNDESTSAYMWEWFTTKPWADSGEIRFIGSVPTPWPSWMIVAHTSAERAPPSEVSQFLSRLTTFVNDFNSPESRAEKDIPFIKKRFGYKEEDIKAWLDKVDYTNDTAEVKESVLKHTLEVLRQAGVVSPETSLDPTNYVEVSVAKLVQSA